MVKKEAKKTTAKRTKPVPAAPLTVAPARAPRPQLTHEMIAKRAYEIWCGKGRPAGTEERNWFEAEQQLFEASDELGGPHSDA